MKNSNSLKNLEVLMTCPVCFEEYSSRHPPVALSCGHTFCKLCVLRLPRGSRFLKCPLDSKKTKDFSLATTKDYLALISEARESYGFSDSFLLRFNASTQCPAQFSPVVPQIAAAKQRILSLESYISLMDSYRFCVYQSNSLHN